jgi:DNA-directed RNA polymerase subunit RPC12/RpoP
MAKCAKCGNEIPDTGKESPNWKLYCKDCGNIAMRLLVKKLKEAK